MPVPVYLSKLSDLVKNDFFKKDVYSKLAAKLELENKIPDTSNLVKKTDYNTKITETEGKSPDISNLAINCINYC